jgi:hypothetical protein
MTNFLGPRKVLPVNILGVLLGLTEGKRRQTDLFGCDVV